MSIAAAPHGAFRRARISERRMIARAYYNEIDPAAAHVLRALIADGVIAPGEVDTRSIKEVQPDDVRGFTQCHFFAGGGLWSVAARLAGWSDDRSLWTGSCPCQPFSVAGKGTGVDDARHLWPDFFRLIRAARPAVVVGEQVAGAAGYGWFDGVAADLENENYAARAVDIPACAVDAPHIRSRLYWVALADGGSQSRQQVAGSASGDETADGQTGRIERQSYGDHGFAGDDEGVGDASRIGRGEGRSEHDVRSWRATTTGANARERSDVGVAERARLEGQRGHGDASGRPIAARPTAAPDGRNGSFWSDAEWIACHDGKARRAKSGIRLLVDGLPGRVDLWRIGGNAIVPHLAAEVLAALIDTIGEAPQ